MVDIDNFIVSLSNNSYKYDLDNSLNSNNFLGANKTLTKGFFIDGIYQLNDNFTKGPKLSDFIVNDAENFKFRKNKNNMLKNIHNTDYYVTQGPLEDKNSYVLKFNEETNEFDCIYCITNNSTGTNYIAIIDSSIYSELYNAEGTEGFYLSNPISKEIGVHINGEDLYYGLYKSAFSTNYIANGYSIIDHLGNNLIGSMPNNGEKVITPTKEEQDLSEGYYKSLKVNAVTNEIDSNIKPENIKKGITILGVEGTYEGEIVNVEEE